GYRPQTLEFRAEHLQGTFDFRYNDAVIRNLVIRRDEAVTGQSEMLKAEENRSERRERRERPEHAESAEGDDSNDSDSSDNADE
ncbi:hypothetical protein ACQKF2_28925, partial [Pseudomonas hunanensis]